MSVSDGLPRRATDSAPRAHHSTATWSHYSSLVTIGSSVPIRSASYRRAVASAPHRRTIATATAAPTRIGGRCPPAVRRALAADVCPSLVMRYPCLLGWVPLGHEHGERRGRAARLKHRTGGRAGSDG